MRQFVFSDTFCFRQFKSAYIQKKIILQLLVKDLKFQE